MEDLKNFEVEEDLRQSREYGEYMQRIGWTTLQITNHKSQIFIKKLGPVGIAKMQRTKGEIDWENIWPVLKKHRVFSLRWEPSNTSPWPPPNLGGGTKGSGISGFGVSNWPLLGTKTLRVNLKPTEEQIFGSFTKDCRYVLRKCKVQSAKCKVNEFDNFYRIWRKSAERKRLWIPPEKEYKALVESFDKNVFCLTADYEAGALILINKKTAFYYYAGGTKQANSDNLPYLVVWEAMKEAKNRGAVVWDFEGIFDSRWPNKGWRGFSHFKKSFGGREVEYPESFQKWLWPF